MAKFRHVYTEFWNDPDVMETFTPEDKLFYLYLLTNSNTSQIGVYQITKKQMAFELGYSAETINSLVDRFVKHHKLVEYNPATREVAIINWGKYNLSKGGKPVEDAVRSDAQKVKHKAYLYHPLKFTTNKNMQKIISDALDENIEISEEVNDINTSHDTSSTRTTTSGQKEKQKEKQKENEKEKNVVGVIFDTFQELGFGTINSYTAEQIDEHLKTFEPEVLIKAMQIASNSNKRTLGYVNGILKNWKDRNIINLKAIEAAEKQREAELAIQGPRYSKVNNREEERPKWLVEKENDSSVKENKEQEPLKTLTEDEDFRKLIANFRDDEAKN